MGFVFDSDPYSNDKFSENEIEQGFVNAKVSNNYCGVSLRGLVENKVVMIFFRYQDGVLAQLLDILKKKNLPTEGFSFYNCEKLLNKLSTLGTPINGVINLECLGEQNTAVPFPLIMKILTTSFSTYSEVEKNKIADLVNTPFSLFGPIIQQNDSNNDNSALDLNRTANNNI